MKRYVVLAALILMFAAPGMAFSQTANPAENNGGPPASGMGGGMGMNRNGGPIGGGPAVMHKRDGKEFQKHKAEILKHISVHLAEIEQRKHCIEAASDGQALRACVPHRGKGGGEKDEGEYPPENRPGGEEQRSH